MLPVSENERASVTLAVVKVYCDFDAADFLLGGSKEGGSLPVWKVTCRSHILSLWRLVLKHAAVCLQECV